MSVCIKHKVRMKSQMKADKYFVILDCSARKNNDVSNNSSVKLSSFQSNRLCLDLLDKGYDILYEPTDIGWACSLSACFPSTPSECQHQHQ